MATASDTRREGLLPHIPVWLGTCIFLAIAVFLLTTEHRAHILGAVPYLLVLLCPIVHLLMPGRHGRHGDHDGHGHHADRREDGAVS